MVLITLQKEFLHNLLTHGKVLQNIIINSTEWKIFKFGTLQINISSFGLARHSILLLEPLWARNQPCWVKNILLAICLHKPCNRSNMRIQQTCSTNHLSVNFSALLCTDYIIRDWNRACDEVCHWKTIDFSLYFILCYDLALVVGSDDLVIH